MNAAFLAGLRSNFPSSLGGEFLGARLAAHAGEFGDREGFFHACNIPRGWHASRSQLHGHRAFSLIVASLISTEEDGITAGSRIM